MSAGGLAGFPPAGAEDLKPLVAFLKRAEEMDGRDPIISYFCRFYAVQLGMAKRTPANKSVVQPILLQMMTRVEEDKKTVALAGNEDIVNDQSLGKEYVRNFAYKVFLKSDNEDRAGNATSKTARNFVIAATFLELLKNFGELDQDVGEKIKYAKWKAADIFKAEKEGRKPVPGPPGGLGADEDFAGGGEGGDAEGAFQQHQQQQQSYQQQDMQQQLQQFYQQPPQQQQQYQQPAQPTQFYQQPQQPSPQFPGPYDQPPLQQQQHQQLQYPGNFMSTPPPQQPVAAPRPQQYQQPPPPPPPQHQHQQNSFGGGGNNNGSSDDYYAPAFDPAQITNAQKFAKFAISALQFEDVPTAYDNLQKSLAIVQAMLANSKRR